MLMINSNVTPSIDIVIKTTDSTVRERISYPLGPERKEELYDLFAYEPSSKWNESETVNEIIEDLKTNWIGNKRAEIQFEFDQQFIDDLERRRYEEEYIEAMLSRETLVDEETDDDFDLFD